MLAAIKDACLGLFEAISNIMLFLRFFLQSFIDFFDKILEVIEILPTWFGFMPYFILGSLLSLIGLLLLLRVLGR